MPKKLVVAVVTMATAVAGLATSASAQIAPTCFGQEATLVGTEGSERINGTAGRDVIVALGGNDIILGLGGNDIICAGGGDDVVYGGFGADLIWGDGGDDVLFATRGRTVPLRSDTAGSILFGGNGYDALHGSDQDDTLVGGHHGDKLWAYQGSDLLRGNHGNDYLNGGISPDTIEGGAGSDSMVLTTFDVADGGAGKDYCQLISGEPNSIDSCGRNFREGAPPIDEEPQQPDVPEPSPPTTPDTTAQIEVDQCRAAAETVRLTNTGTDTVTLDGWVLHDRERNHEAELDGIRLDPDDSVVLRSGNRPASPGQIKWADDHVWNNSGDTAFLLDPAGKLADRTECT